LRRQTALGRIGLYASLGGDGWAEAFPPERSIVLPTLSPEDLQRIAAGELLLDDFIYVYVHDELGYRYTIAPDVAVARAVEDAARGGALYGRKRFLNPLPAPARPSKAARAAAIRPGRH
jgi:hypothetical protein